MSHAHGAHCYVESIRVTEREEDGETVFDSEFVHLMPQGPATRRELRRAPDDSGISCPTPYCEDLDGLAYELGRQPDGLLVCSGCGYSWREAEST